MGGQLLFDWERPQNFLISNKITNTISYAKVEYHMCKYSAVAPSPLMHRKAKCLLRLNHDCNAIGLICRAS